VVHEPCILSLLLDSLEHGGLHLLIEQPLMAKPSFALAPSDRINGACEKKALSERREQSE